MTIADRMANELTEATAPRRLRAQDVIEGYKEIIEQLTQRGSEPYVTVEHTLNAKGDTQTSVKVSAPMGHDLGDLQAYATDVEAIAATIYDQATGRYPRSITEPSSESDKKARTAAAIARAQA